MVDILNFAHGNESNDYKWTEYAFDLMTNGRLTVTLTGPTGGRVIARGTCPRCDHEIDYSFDETIVVPQGSGGTLSSDTKRSPSPTGTRREDDAADSVHYVTVSVLCQCREEHPGGPSKSLGCGIIFNTDLKAP